MKYRIIASAAILLLIVIMAVLLSSHGTATDSNDNTQTEYINQ